MGAWPRLTNYQPFQLRPSDTRFPTWPREAAAMGSGVSSANTSCHGAPSSSLTTWGGRGAHRVASGHVQHVLGAGGATCAPLWWTHWAHPAPR